MLHRTIILKTLSSESLVRVYRPPLYIGQLRRPLEVQDGQLRRPFEEQDGQLRRQNDGGVPHQHQAPTIKLQQQQQQVILQKQKCCRQLRNGLSDSMCQMCQSSFCKYFKSISKKKPKSVRRWVSG